MFILTSARDMGRLRDHQQPGWRKMPCLALILLSSMSHAWGPLSCTRFMLHSRHIGDGPQPLTDGITHMAPHIHYVSGGRSCGTTSPFASAATAVPPSSMTHRLRHLPPPAVFFVQGAPTHYRLPCHHHFPPMFRPLPNTPSCAFSRGGSRNQAAIPRN